MIENTVPFNGNEISQNSVSTQHPDQNISENEARCTKCGYVDPKEMTQHDTGYMDTLIDTIFKGQRYVSARRRAWFGGQFHSCHQDHSGAHCGRFHPGNTVIVLMAVLSLLVLQSAAEPELLKRQFAAPLPLKSSRTQHPVAASPASLCTVKCKSPKQRPFCASDGKTYSSKCEVRKVIKCEKKELRIVSKGRCGVAGRVGGVGALGNRRQTGGTNVHRKCEDERQRQLTAMGSNSSNNTFVPKCHPNGSYVSVQCYTGYCWCVSKDGKPIPATSVKGAKSKPNCNRGVKRATKTRRGKKLGAQKRKCGRPEKEAFTAALVKLFADDYSRIPADGKNNEPTVDVIIDWKFDELDSNKDSFLKLAEIKSLSRMTRKQVKPKFCAKKFPKYCDSDKNNSITKKEWSECLKYGGINDKMSHKNPGPKPVGGSPSGRPNPQGARTTRKKPGGGERRPGGPSLVDKQQPGQSNVVTESRPDMPETQPSNVTDCFEARRQQEENEKNSPDDQIFVPECVDGGMYKKEQCHKYTGYCWCVEEKSGKPIPGYATHNKTPNCSQAKPERPLKGCPYSKKQQYLTEVLDVLTDDMMKYGDEHRGEMDNILQNPNYSLEERAVRWKFSMLDSNRNQQLDRKESKRLKDVFKVSVQAQGQPSLRKCARNFLRYCDEDSNGKITIDEWVECLRLNESQREESGPRKRAGTNPLELYLKSS